MTPRKAIEILERLQEPEPWEPQITSETWEALQMGIDALESDSLSESGLMARIRAGRGIPPIYQKQEDKPWQ